MCTDAIFWVQHDLKPDLEFCDTTGLFSPLASCFHAPEGVGCFAWGIGGWDGLALTQCLL